MKFSATKERFRLVPIAIGVLLMVTSCMSPGPIKPPVAFSANTYERDTEFDRSWQNVSNGSFWAGDRMTGSPSVIINLAEQRAYLFKGRDLAGVSHISSGREGHDTLKGSFKIIEKDSSHKSSLFGNYVDARGVVVQKDVDTSKDPMPMGAFFEGASMPNFMRIVNGIGMHEGFLPGYAASHGCIRMPRQMAEAFFRTVSLGTPVRIE